MVEFRPVDRRRAQGTEQLPVFFGVRPQFFKQMRLDSACIIFWCAARPAATYAQAGHGIIWQDEMEQALHSRYESNHVTTSLYTMDSFPLWTSHLWRLLLGK